MSDEDLVKIGDEMVRIVGPIYKDLDYLKNNVNELRDDVGALKVEVHDIHLKIGSGRDEFLAFKDNTEQEVSVIKKQIGLSPDLS
jgi:hypothetical protein